MDAIYPHPQSSYNKHNEGTMSTLCSETRLASENITLNQANKAGMQQVDLYEGEQDEMDVKAIERQLLDLDMHSLMDNSMAGTSRHPREFYGEELPWYYYIRISPEELNPDDINPTYKTTDNFQLHTWIMADGEMGTSVTSNLSLEYLPLGKDNVDLIARHLEDYLEEFLDQDIGTHLWVYLAMPEVKDKELLDIMSLQVDQIRATLTSFADEVSVTVDVINSVDWMKASCGLGQKRGAVCIKALCIY